MKKKIISLLLIGVMATAIIGCGETSSTGSTTSTSTSTTQKKEETKKEEPKKEENNENRQTVLDNSTVKIEYVKIEKTDIETDIVMHAENKSSKEIVIQPETSISLDDTMYSCTASQEIQPGKKADFKMMLTSTDGSDLKIPDFKKISGTLNVLDKDFQPIVQQKFNVNK